MKKKLNSYYITFIPFNLVIYQFTLILKITVYHVSNKEIKHAGMMS